MSKRVTPLLAVVVGLGGGVAAAERSPAPAATPRTLPTGAPACGNAQSKSPQPCVEPAAPRVLASGAPACGNVLSKVDGNAQDPMYLSCVRGEQPARVIVNKMVIARVMTLLGIPQTTVAPAEPRRLRTGAPANGNVARRTVPAAEPPRRENHHD